MGSGFSSGTTAKQPATHTTTARVMGEDVELFAGDADPVTLSILQLVKLSDAAEREGHHVTMMVHLKNALILLKEVPEEHIDSISVLLFQREGFANYLSRNVAAAKASFAKAIQIAEVMVAERRPHLYMVLQRYCDSILCLSSMWEKESATAYDLDAKRQASSQSSGSHAAVSRINVKEDTPNAAQLARSVAIYGPCEVALLRCIQLIEMGDHRQSDLLILPLLELSRIYEALQIYTRAVLIIRRCIGLLCVRYGHSHMRLIDLNARCERLVVLRDEQILLEAVIKLQSLARMFKAMHRLEATLNRRVKVHRLPPRVVREHMQGRNQDFLAAYVGIIGKQQASQLPASVAPTTAMPPLKAGVPPTGALQQRGGGGNALSVVSLQSSLDHHRRDDGEHTPSPLALSTSSPSSELHTAAAAAAVGASTSTSRPTSSSPIRPSLTVRQTALVNSGYTSTFARSSFAVGSRPGSGGPSSSRPTSALMVSPQEAPMGIAANKMIAIRPPQDAARAAVRPSQGATATTPQVTRLTVDRGASVHTAVAGRVDDAAQPTHRRSRLRSWAAYDPTQ